MRRTAANALLSFLLYILGAGCTQIDMTRYPDPNELFVTTGDGNIQKPYTPIGLVAVKKQGFYMFGQAIIAADLEAAINDRMLEKAREMGGDGVIEVTLFNTGSAPIWMPIFFNDITAVGQVIRR
jgi:hypothetical protein